MKKYRISRNNMAYGQMGMQQPSQEEMMMMQQQQAQQQQAPAQQDPQKQVIQLAQQVSAVIQKGKDAETVAQELLQTNIPPQAIGQAFEMLVQQGVVDESEMQAVAQMVMASEGEQQQAQPSEEEMIAMQQQQAATQQPPMARAGYIKKQMKARAGMSVDQEAAFGSATNLIADKNMQKNDLLKFTQDNVAANQFGQEYDQMYTGGNLEQARYGMGKARRQDRRDARTADQGDNFAKNQGMRSRQLARRAVREMPDVYSRADKRALREGLESGEFDKYDVYRGVDVFNPQPNSKPGYPEVDAGSFDQTMIPGRDWGMQPSVEEDMPAEEMVEETSTEPNVITDFDNAYDYKNENGIIYTRKKGAADWTKVDSESNAGRAIRKKVYGEDDVTFDADATGKTIMPHEVDEFESEDGYMQLGEDGNPILGEDGQPCEEWQEGTSGQTFVEWASNLPYDENGLYTTNCGEIYNRTNLPGYNRENIEARTPGGAGYSGAYVEENPNMQFGGQYSSDGLEMARFGRGRALRQARRADRQGRRAMRQADRAMRSVYDNIAFPPGVSPMMAGMPIMGPNGAGSDMMQFYGKRGLLGGLREFSMNMPVNFGRGMFFNGMFNPYGMQGGYNDMRYKITYPGQESEVTADAEAEKQVEGAKENQDLEDKTKQKGQQEEEKKQEEEANNTADTTEEKDENGISKNCGENASVNEAGQCQCNKGYVRDLNIQTFSCISEAELAASKDDEDPEGTNWVYLALGAGTIGGGIWALRKIAPKVRALISKNPAASKTAREALLKQIVNQFPSGTQMASGTKLLNEGVSRSYPNITGTQMTEAEIRAGREAAETAVQQAGTRGEAQVVKGAIEGSGPRALLGNMNAADRALINTQRIAQEGIDRAALEKLAQKNGIQNITGKKTGELLRELRLIANPGITPPLTRNAPKILSNAQKQVLKAELAAAEKSTAAAARKLAQKYGVKVAANASKQTIMKLLRKALPIVQTGGSVDPNLYMFTGGGAPDYVDYFADGGYYNEGGYYGDGGFPQYENVYDPYMPMAGNGMTMVDRPYATAAEYGDEYAAYPGPYAEPIITDQIRESVINSGKPMSQMGIYNTLMDKDDPNAGRKTNQLYKAMQNPGPSAQYGGYQEGDVVDMTEAELGAFLAGGGQVEFVD